jgi:hypothetical protein
VAATKKRTAAKKPTRKPAAKRAATKRAAAKPSKPKRTTRAATAGGDTKAELAQLDAFLRRVPAIGSGIGTGVDKGMWWAKFAIDIDHPLAWRVVQELGHILNYVSVSERLPTVFMPVSPPPYLNGGAKDFLSWVIESTSETFTPGNCLEWLEGRMPQPIDDVAAWAVD